MAFQLYSEENHFLYELIQNADDLDYGGETPALELDLYQGPLPRLEIQSNELGFSRENVEAICAAGQSTKLGKSGTIGEKGIGFKSVFRMAHKAWICSRFYSFALDTATPGMGAFGMVIPTWVPNDVAVAQDFGSIITLYLRGRPEENSLLGRFKDFDFTFLLFCRRLKRIQFRLVYSDNKEEIRKGEWINPNLQQTIQPSARGPKKGATPFTNQKSCRCLRKQKDQELNTLIFHLRSHITKRVLLFRAKQHLHFFRSGIMALT